MTTEPDFYLYTDGSGHTDGFGGWAALILSTRHNVYSQLMAGHSATTVARAEFHALLDGLQFILETMKWESPLEIERLEREPATVLWNSDREDLVRSVTRDAEGNPIYRRKASPDLWARFAFYERLFQIEAQHTPRETNPYHNIVDRFASDARVLIKDYVQLPDNTTGRLLSEALRVRAP